ncbi:hypothetical protein SDC9_98790 [bioreactor metagenome]|uniref:Uncharacterized protein n=1 Tax=bioreactor metagenome TaxID=1076179 RepID=A0A645AG96_9ZZZZ
MGKKKRTGVFSRCQKSGNIIFSVSTALLLKRGERDLRILQVQQKIQGKKILITAFSVEETKKKLLLQLQYIRMEIYFQTRKKKEYATGISAVFQTFTLHFFLIHLFQSPMKKTLKLFRDLASMK